MIGTSCLQSWINSRSQIDLPFGKRQLVTLGWSPGNDLRVFLQVLIHPYVFISQIYHPNIDLSYFMVFSFDQEYVPCHLDGFVDLGNDLDRRIVGRILATGFSFDGFKSSAKMIQMETVEKGDTIKKHART